jgi:predicted PurR-regulated permease PerM
MRATSSPPELPGPPSWVASIPVIGARIDEQWRLIATDRSELEVMIAPYVQVLGRWGLDAGVNVGLGLAQGTLELALALFITFFFYRDGAALALRIQGGLARLAGERGLRLLDVAGNTVQAVVYGVVGTALVQAALMLIGLMIAGVPNAILLAFLVGITSPLPIGPPLVWIGAAIYLYLTDGIGWASSCWSGESRSSAPRTISFGRC